MPFIQDATDADLRMLTNKHEYIIVKFIDEECAICKELAPSFQVFADTALYKDILFLRIDAKENPVSSNEVRMSGTPFIVTYKGGTIKECRLVQTEAGIKEMLDKLLTY